MRYALSVAALAAGALAAPRYVTEWDVTTTVDVITVYATGDAPKATPTESLKVANHWGKGGDRWSAPAPMPTTTAEAYTTTEAAPYVAPTTSSVEASTFTSIYVAPTTSEEATSTMAAPTTEAWVAPSVAPVWSAPASIAAPVFSAPAPVFSAPASTQASTGAIPTDYAGVAVYQHNLHRANHSASAVTWSTKLAGYAQQQADQCGGMVHDMSYGGGGYGQNLAGGSGSEDIAAVIAGQWYNEVNRFTGLYGQASPAWPTDDNMAWGHFTQVVWKGTTEIGCATTDCSSSMGMSLTVCNYGSAGNMEGEFDQNVSPPAGAAPSYGKNIFATTYN